MPPPKPHGHGQRPLSKLSSMCGHRRSSVFCRHWPGKQQGSRATLAGWETCRTSPGLRDGLGRQEESAEPLVPARHGHLPVWNEDEMCNNTSLQTLQLELNGNHLADGSENESRVIVQTVCAAQLY